MRGDFRLGEWIVRPRRECVQRGDETVHVHPKSMSVLVHLANADGEVVTRNELFTAIWPDVIVTDDSLTQCVVELRKAFGDSAKDQEIIRTIPKVGFCLVPPVFSLDEGKKERSAPSIPVAIGVLVLIVLASAFIGLYLIDRTDNLKQGPLEQPSLVVLPFVNMSSDPEQEYFSDGISEELLNLLAKTSGLKVISHTSAFRFKGSDRDIPAIARSLGVSHVLEGSVRKSGDRVRITVQLVDARSDTHLWSETYDRDLSGIFAIQDEIARNVVNEVKVTLSHAYPQSRPVSNPEAYSSYLLGNYQLHKLNVKRARQHFAQAIELEPTYAVAHLSLARCYGWETFLGYTTPRVGYSKIQEEIEAALEADSRLPEIHRPTAEMNFYYKWNWEAAEAAFIRAVEQVPSDAHAYQLYAWFLSAMDRTEKAREVIGLGIGLEPLAAPMYVTASNVHYMAGAYEEAVDLLNSALELSPDHPLVLSEFGWNYVQMNRFGEAIDVMERSVALEPGNTQHLWSLGHAYAVSGRVAEARRVLNELHSMEGERYILPFGIALIHAGMGEKDKAIDWLERAYDERNGWMVYLNVEPRLDPLRSEPRFRELLARMDFPDRALD